MKYTVQTLLESIDEKVKYLFFWGHTPNKDGSIGKSCFSQWWEQAFEVEGITYNTAEHWMMAGKARLFNDEEILAKILVAKSPGEAKKLGRKVRNFDGKIWNQKKYQIVLEGNIHKFSQHDDLKTFLLNTNNRVLVEASPYDAIWGIGMTQNHEDAAYPEKWKGQNLLGFALMEARDFIRNKN